MSSSIPTDNNRLSAVCKELSEQWHPTKNCSLTPDNITSQSNKKVWWLCKNLHEWEKSVNYRMRRKRCPYCELEENSLAKKNPTIALQWDMNKNGYLSPNNVYYGSHKKVWWLCYKKHSWNASIKSRVEGNGCPYCSNQKVCIDNCLETLSTELAKEWHPIRNENITPKDVVAGSHKKVWWKCSSNHEWIASIVKRTNGHNCPLCDKVILKHGIACDSLPEAIICLNYIENGIKFLHNKRYHKDFGKYRYDFYIPQENKYVEVTAFRINSKTVNYFTYLRKIVKKKRFVENVLKAKFEFIQFTPTKDQIDKVRENTI